MEIGDWSATEDLNDLYRDIRTLGLESNLAELEAFGFTVIENALSPEVTTKLREAVLRAAEQKFERPLDLEGEEQHREVQLIPYLLYRDPIFEEALLNPKPLALTTYLLGRHCLLSSMTSHLKGPGGGGLLLHSDTGNGMPQPFSAYSHVTNTNYALTDYTEAGGALAMVPGSHQMHRQPTAFEKGLDGNERNPHAIAIEVPAGSAIVWHGNTWHGSFPRKIPGLRINLAVYFCRQYMQPQENYKDYVPEGLIEKYGEDSRIATLLGGETQHGWRYEGPSPNYQKKRAVVGRSWQA
jgi:hypothetical protein